MSTRVYLLINFKFAFDSVNHDIRLNSENENRNTNTVRSVVDEIKTFQSSRLSSSSSCPRF